MAIYTFAVGPWLTLARGHFLRSKTQTCGDRARAEVDATHKNVFIAPTGRTRKSHFLPVEDVRQIEY